MKQMRHSHPLDSVKQTDNKVITTMVIRPLNVSHIVLDMKFYRLTFQQPSFGELDMGWGGDRLIRWLVNIFLYIPNAGSPLTHPVYLLPILSYLDDSKSVCVCLSDPEAGYDANYRLDYRFAQRQQMCKSYCMG